MELPKNITQIGESDHRSKIYVEDYVVSYMKQLNKIAEDKDIAIALYGKRSNEQNLSYYFIYGASKLDFLQKEVRHLSQAQTQEIEKNRKRYFPEHDFIGYHILNGEMIEGFHVYEQDVCRYIKGYACFYEKNDSMLAYMLDTHKEEHQPEEVGQERFDRVKQRQEERKAQFEVKEPVKEPRIRKEPVKFEVSTVKLMRYSAVAMFAILCFVGISTLNGEDGLGASEGGVRQFFANVTEQKIPDTTDTVPVISNQVTLDDKLTEALKQENDASQNETEVIPAEPEPIVEQPDTTTVPEETPEVEVEPEPEVVETTEPVVSQQETYEIKQGDTLIGISRTKYGTDSYVKTICELNNIVNPDNIQVGQKILLP